jgi:hypothetical protein
MKPKDLGKSFFEEPAENNGYFRGVERLGKTKVILCADDYYMGIPATVTRINIGLDYTGKKISRFAEEIRLFNLRDGTGRQVVEYLHSAPLFEEKDDGKFELKDLVMKPFARYFRSKRHIKINDLLRHCSNSQSI